MLPESFTVIDDGTFNECRNLKEVEIKGTLEVIGEKAFATCYALEKVTFQAQERETGTICPPDSLQYVGNEAFFQCPKLKRVEYDSSHTSFGQNPFNMEFVDRDYERQTRAHQASQKKDMEIVSLIA